MSRTRSHNRDERELRKRRSIAYELNHKKEIVLPEVKQPESELVITNHALVRFAERVLKLDISAIKKQILSDEVLRLHKELGNGKFPNDNFHVVIENNIVKTII